MVGIARAGSDAKSNICAVAIGIVVALVIALVMLS
ncbi:hypothetical protein LCGC14_1550760 [marine sediment metagenome]|uniref:Uncharacterized protein n=1 Tax=marine sediment metagenome TaxID=412755 RepID=A0A0F9IQB0_9ZZZZ